MANHKHNIFHYISVVCLKFITLIMAGAGCFYLVLMGLLLCRSGVAGGWALNLSLYFIGAPYYLEVKTVAEKIGFLLNDGCILTTIVGLPLLIAGGSFFIVQMISLYDVICKKDVNEMSCPLCKGYKD